jgi:hypothetical protein
MFVITFSLFFTSSFAAILAYEDQSYSPCNGLYSTAQCCATDVLGVADLDCGIPPGVPFGADDFSAMCAGMGQRARCCVLPILGQDILCNTPHGISD